MGRSDAARAFTFFLPHLSTDDFLLLNNHNILFLIVYAMFGCIYPYK